MLTTPACNALLKTLEEPPAHCIFILATTEAHKLPATIRSRCQIIEFKKAEVSTLVDLLIEVAKAEGVKLDTGGAKAIANLGDGSYRDTFSIFEKCIGLSMGGEIDKELVDSVYSTPDREFAVQIIKKISEGDTDALMLEIAKLKEKHVSAKQLLGLLIDSARIALMSRFDKNHVYIQKSKNIFTEEQFQTLCDSGSKAKFPINSQALSSLISTHQIISESISDDWLYVELAIVALLESHENK
jgi:DNA polymerase III gamma/tau subunit